MKYCQVSMFDMQDQDTLFGKTSRERLAAITEKTSVSSSKKLQKSLTKMPLFLNLTKTGQRVGQSWEMGTLLLGEYTTHSFGESPKDVVESHLSQILEDNPHPKYYLSGRACLGILSRAKRKGKELPKELENALQEQAEWLSKNTIDFDGINISQEVTVVGVDFKNQASTGAVAKTLTTASRTDSDHTGGDNVPDIVRCYRKKAHPRNADEGQGWEETNKADTLNVFDNSEKRTPILIKQQGEKMGHWKEHCRVRRLTPLECERLQGMPDGWTDIPPFTDEEITDEVIEFFKKVWYGWDCIEKGLDKAKERSDKWIKAWLQEPTKDAPRYKALGNGIATPYWKVLLKRISAQYERDATMGSLFDGIGSFPMLWEQINGEGSCLWSSEIEPFPIKVTVYRFGLEGAIK